MKKTLLTSIIIFLFFGQLFAQTDPARVEQDHIFQYIDKSQIPTGYLKEYGAQFANLKTYNKQNKDSIKCD